MYDGTDDVYTTAGFPWQHCVGALPPRVSVRPRPALRLVSDDAGSAFVLCLWFLFEGVYVPTRVPARSTTTRAGGVFSVAVVLTHAFPHMNYYLLKVMTTDEHRLPSLLSISKHASDVSPPEAVVHGAPKAILIADPRRLDLQRQFARSLIWGRIPSHSRLPERRNDGQP